MIMLTYITFICAYLALRKKMHLRIDFLYRRMPLVIQSACFFIVYLVIASVAVVMTYWGFQQAFGFPGQVTEVMRIPVSAVYIVIPLSGLAIIMSALMTIYQGIRTDVNWVPQKTSWLCNGMMKCGVAIRDTAGLIEILNDET